MPHTRQLRRVPLAATEATQHSCEAKVVSKFELNIITNDGWVVTLVTDKPVNLGDVVMSTIIVQPSEEHFKRVTADTEDVTRSQYRLRPVQ